MVIEKLRAFLACELGTILGCDQVHARDCYIYNRSQDFPSIDLVDGPLFPFGNFGKVESSLISV